MSRFRSALHRVADAGRGTASLARLLRAVAAVALPERRQLRPGPVAVPNLAGRVEVLVDRWGVPHVYAGTREDAFAAQGYLHARDRLWQMELHRRLGHGRLAELFGAGALAGDRFVRVLGLGRIAQQEAAELPPETARAVAAYVGGVNAWLAGPDRPPMEFRLLRHRPEPWSAADVLVWGKVVALTMGTNWAAELLRARVEELAGPEAVAELQTDGGRPAVPAGSYPAPPRGSVRLPYQGQGSNAWAVDGTRTVHGAPLLASDPHLRVQFPIIWYENHLHAEDLHVTGASMPGAPGVLIGHNERVAWGFTNARIDVQDLYMERLDDADRYLHDGRWLPLTVRTEEIVVRDRPEPHRERVRSTRHGPLVSGVLGTAGPGSTDPAESARSELALAWTATEPGECLTAVLAVNDARDWASFRAAVGRWTAPAQHFVYADVDGAIGSVLGGTVPLRAAGNGQAPVSGWTGEFDWTGTIPPEELPQQRSPVDGLVVSANNRIVGDDYPYPLPGEWMASFRADRIRQLLTARPRHDVASFAAMQSDVVSLPGLRLAALADRLPADTPAERAARRLLADWDGRLYADSGAGAVYQALRTALLSTAYAHLAEPLALTAGLGLFTFQPGLEFLDYAALPGLLDRLTTGTAAAEPAATADSGVANNSAAADSTGAAEPGGAPGAGREAAVLADAWRQAVAALVERLGPDVGRWRYGDLHRLVIRHPFGQLPLLGRWVNRGPYPVGGDVDTVCAANLIAEPDGTQIYDGASYRQVCDLGDWDRSVSVLPTGQSGRPANRHYADHTPLWLRGEHHPMRWSRAEIERDVDHQLLLIPSDRGAGPWTDQ